MIQKPRGTFDILPEEMGLWLKIEETARRVAAKFGFGEIRFPTFEATELFQRGVGDTTDVVQKEMYTFEDREGRSLSLRPEGTAGAARLVLENGKHGDPMPLRLFYLINCFRYEKPQAGRSREFFQFGAEMYGAATPMADADIIAMAGTFLAELGLQNITLHLNSIGCPHCRPQYRDALKSYFAAHEAELCDTCKKRLATNPLRVLDCKSPICSALAANAPKTIDHLCPDCKAHMDALTTLLDEMGIDYVIDPHIVRGLDYYTRTVFEFICPVIGAQSTVCGGGRYDGLVEELGGPALPAIGFAAGITRLILAMRESGVENPALPTPKLYICTMGAEASAYAAKTVAALRKKGVYAEYDLVGRSVKAQMKYANKLHATYTVVVGESELATGKAALKNMADGTTTEVALASLADLL